MPPQARFLSRVIVIKKKADEKKDWMDKAIILGNFISTAGDLAPFPYLKSAGGILVMLLQPVQQMQKNQDSYEQLTDSIVEILQILVDEVIANVEAAAQSPRFKETTIRVNECLQEIQNDVAKMKRKSTVMQYLSSASIRDRLDEYRSRIDRLRINFILQNTIATRLAVDLMSRSPPTSSADATITDDAVVPGYRSFTYGDLELVKEVDQQPQFDWYRQYLAKSTQADFADSKHVWLYQGEKGLKKWKQDLELLSKIRHPNIIQMFGYSKTPEHAALVFHQGPSLRVDGYLEMFSDDPIELTIQEYQVINGYRTGFEYLRHCMLDFDFDFFTSLLMVDGTSDCEHSDHIIALQTHVVLETGMTLLAFHVTPSLTHRIPNHYGASGSSLCEIPSTWSTNPHQKVINTLRTTNAYIQHPPDIHRPPAIHLIDVMSGFCTLLESQFFKLDSLTQRGTVINDLGLIDAGSGRRHWLLQETAELMTRAEAPVWRGSVSTTIVIQQRCTNLRGYTRFSFPASWLQGGETYADWSFKLPSLNSDFAMKILFSYVNVILSEIESRAERYRRPVITTQLACEFRLEGKRDCKPWMTTRYSWGCQLVSYEYRAVMYGKLTHPSYFLFVSDPTLSKKRRPCGDPDMYWSIDPSGTERLGPTELLRTGLVLPKVKWVSYDLEFSYKVLNRFRLLLRKCGVDPSNAKEISELLDIPFIPLQEHYTHRQRKNNKRRASSLPPPGSGRFFSQDYCYSNTSDEVLYSTAPDGVLSHERKRERDTIPRINQRYSRIAALTPAITTAALCLEMNDKFWGPSFPKERFRCYI
ncbi:hypothetical protein M422DRAFT_778945 [Sphaerobolus stellatus SS14]|uniref:Unplaced genomic scaffold SPHSTscaffold_37, whole genome shotgun sequence n=1 Tax=Sphaerobolus stellatus (strain SS14) TaxID=990650 RepID=A0A0C9W2T5_SPHS4|nr:hypothetical protein M422DRAFT_778945 [Sphaerobolus stellatus SS14]